MSAMIPESFRAAMNWNATQLTSADEALIESWPLTLRVEIAGVGPVVLVTPVLATTPRLAPATIVTSRPAAFPVEYHFPITAP